MQSNFRRSELKIQSAGQQRGAGHQNCDRLQLSSGNFFSFLTCHRVRFQVVYIFRRKI
jgi:hypothetical protein